MTNPQGNADTVVELAVDEFEGKWRKHYDSVFSGHDMDKGPFRDPAWRILPIGGPAYYFGSYSKPLTPDQQQHLGIYDAIGRSASRSGDMGAVGFLRGGPHRNPSIFLIQSLTAASIYALKQAALDGFDMHVFSVSESWGLAMSWEEEVAVIGGGSAFQSTLFNAVGGEGVLKKDFEQNTAYLLNLGDAAAHMVGRLRSQAGW